MHFSRAHFSKIGRSVVKINSAQVDVKIIDSLPTLSHPTCTKSVVVKGNWLVNWREEEEWIDGA